MKKVKVIFLPFIHGGALVLMRVSEKNCRMKEWGVYVAPPLAPL